MAVDVTQQDSCLKALLAGIVDYAGLFPPAKLPMDRTVHNYAEYLGGEHAWMLGRLVVPTARLDEFEQHAEGVLPPADNDEPWHITMLTAAAGDPGFEADLERIRVFHDNHGRRAHIGVIELRGPDARAIERTLDLVPDAIFPFFELPVHDDPRGLIAAISGSDAGAKVRTGGVGADAYPQPAELVRFISACAAADVPFKATAGLHHPLRHFSDAVGTEEFGFLNVFVAAALARSGALDEAELAEVLVEGDPDAFVFEGDHLAIGDHRLTAAQINDARAKFAVSFGSCSFTEPIEDLRAIRLL